MFHGQTTSIRASTLSCHGIDYIYSKCGVLCPPAHPQGVCFQHNAWDHAQGAMQSVTHVGWGGDNDTKAPMRETFTRQ